MKILFISHSSLATGSERVLADIINSRINSDKCYVSMPKGKRDDLTSIINNCIKIKLYYKNVSTSNLKSLICCLYNLPSLIYLSIFLIIKKIDLIYVNTSVNLLGVLLCLILKKNVVFHIHEQPNTNIKVISNLLFPIYRRFFHKKNVKLVFTSLRCKESWEKELNVKLDLYEIVNPPIRNIELNCNHLLQEENKITYGYLGTFHSSKNIIVLLKAFALLVENSDKNISLLLFGSGPLIEEIHVNIEALGIKDKVKVLSYSEDVSLFYSMIDVLVQPSLNESWSMVVVESMNLKIPTIVTIESGIADLLVHEKDSLLINPLDINEIYMSMKKMLYFDFRDSVAKNAYEKYCSLDLNNVFHKKINDIISTN